MEKTILITGASGFIGSNLVDTLLENNYKIIGLSKNYPLKALNLEQFNSINYTPLQGDITDENLVNNLFETYQPQIVIHLAAQALVEKGISGTEHTFNVNVKGTWNVFEACQKLNNLDRIIVASSDKAYGEHEKLPYKEDFELRAVYPYDLSKKMTEEVAMSYYHTHKLPIVITRCGNTFGPYDLNKSRIVPSVIISCLRNEKIKLRSSGTQKRCYVFAKDVANAYLKMIEAPLEIVIGQAFNIGNDNAISVLDMANLISRTAGIDPAKNIIIEDTAQYEIAHQSLDSNKAKKLLNWQPTYSLDEAIQSTIAWFSAIDDKSIFK